MTAPKRRRLVASVAIFLLIIGLAVWVRNWKTAPEPAGSDYFTGAFHSKGDPSKCYTDDGKSVPCPVEPAATTAPKSKGAKTPNS